MKKKINKPLSWNQEFIEWYMNKMKRFDLYKEKFGVPELLVVIAENRQDAQREVFIKLIQGFKDIKSVFPEDKKYQALLRVQIQFLKEAAFKDFKIKIK